MRSGRLGRRHAQGRRSLASHSCGDNAMMIRDASIWQGGRWDLRIEDGRIAEIGHLVARPDEMLIDAQGAALLPGLHDHHLHLTRELQAALSPEETAQLASILAKLTQAL